MDGSAGHEVQVPEAVRLRAEMHGDVGRRWLASLPDVVRGFERDWDIRVGGVLQGGSAAYVAHVTMADGTSAVLKVHMPSIETLAGELRVLQIANGRGYVRLLRRDEGRGALLQERLGPRLSRLGFSVRTQMTIICKTLQRAWIQPPDPSVFQSGVDKARYLRDFTVRTWETLGRPCPENLVEHAYAFSREREAAFDPERAVLLHGDAHGDNTLAPFGGEISPASTFSFIDPEGLFAERAYDLSVLMRAWTRQLVAGDPLTRGRERCHYLAELTGEAPEAIWQWGFMERVSTGFLLLHMGREAEGRDFLRVAQAWMQS